MTRTIKDEKVCTGCGRLLPRNAFSPSWRNPKTGTQYVTSKCKRCMSLYNGIRNAKRRKADPAFKARWNEIASECTRRRRARIKADPVAYATHREAERKRCKVLRLKKALAKHGLKEK